jgi:hypothetical protein
VTPYVVLTFVSETDVRPYIVLKTRLDPGTALILVRSKARGGRDAAHRTRRGTQLRGKIGPPRRGRPQGDDGDPD